jgi:2,3-bisphosphoglycerate-dependent phosphoglycerate mutase
MHYVVVGTFLYLVYERAVPFYKNTILPRLLNGENVLIVAHGNSIRALMKYIESISDEDVSKLEMLFGQIIIYDISQDGLRQDSSIVKIETITPPNA